MPFSDSNILRTATSDQDLEEVRDIARRMGALYRELVAQQLPEKYIDMNMYMATNAEFAHGCAGEGDV